MPYEVKVPQVGESITEVTIGQWLKESGEFVREDDIICEIESEKATLEVPAGKSGRLKILVQEGETVPIGHTIAEIEEAAEEAAPAPEAGVGAQSVPEKEAPEVEKAEAAKAKSKVSPVAAKILKEAGIPPEQIKGSGTGGRITKKDVLQAVKSGAQATVANQPEAVPAEVSPRPAPATEPPPPARPKTGERRERREKMSTLRKTIARRLVAAKNETAMLTTFNEVDMSAILEARAKYKELFQEKYGVRLGFMSFFIKACAIALLESPQVNASIDGDEVIYHDYCDISIAVSTPKGLVVPVIFNAHLLTMAEIEAEVARLAQRARDRKLSIEEMTGGTFSITNGGVFGSLLSTPIINPPQSAILGMHKIEERPVALNGQVVIRPMMYLAMSYDHRIIDGKESVSFLVRVKELLEDPLRMLVEV